MFRNIDSIVLSIPSAALGVVGVGMRYLEETEVPLIKEIGWFGSRSAIVLGTLCGAPLLVWTFAKAAFAKLLNGVTLEQCDTFKDLDNHCNQRLTLIFSGLPLYPIFCMHMPSIIRSTKHANELQQKMMEEVRLISNRVNESAQYWKW